MIMPGYHVMLIPPPSKPLMTSANAICNKTPVSDANQIAIKTSHDMLQCDVQQNPLCHVMLIRSPSKPLMTSADAMCNKPGTSLHSHITGPISRDANPIDIETNLHSCDVQQNILCHVMLISLQSNQQPSAPRQALIRCATNPPCHVIIIALLSRRNGKLMEKT
jgi:hypothetical protein